MPLSLTGFHDMCLSWMRWLSQDRLSGGVGLLVQDLSQLASSERLLTRGVSETEVFPKVGLTRGLSQLGLTRGFSEVVMTRGFSEVGLRRGFSEVGMTRGFSEVRLTMMSRRRSLCPSSAPTQPEVCHLQTHNYVFWVWTISSIISLIISAIHDQYLFNRP